MNTVVSFGVLLVALVVAIFLSAPEIPVVPLVALLSVIAVATPLLFFPSSRTLWTAIDVLMNPLAPDEVDPEHRLRNPTS